MITHTKSAVLKHIDHAKRQPLHAMPEVSIIIVVKNDLGIRRTLELIYAQHTTIKYEVIVVDASEPEYLQSIRAQFPQVHWEMFDQAGKRFTISEQRNRGL